MPIVRIGRRSPHAALRPSAPAFVPLLLVCIAPLLTATAHAQIQIDPVIVTGTREPQPLAHSTADVVLIGAEAIRNSTADSVEDLLRREAGVQVGRNGGPGQTAGYFIRGASANGTVVLIDGVRVGSATLGQAELESLSLSQIDHIEVLRGPASSLYGADGVGGVVQIFTRRGVGAPRLTAHAALGGERSRHADLGVSGSQSGFDYAVSAAHDSSRGVSAIRPGDQFGLYNPDDDGYHRNVGNFRLGYTPAAGHRVGVSVIETHLNAQYDGADYNPPDFTPDASPDFRTRLKTRLATVDYRGEISPSWTTTLQASNNVDDSTSGGTSVSRFMTRRDQATWQNALHFGPDQQVVLAYEHLRERVTGDVFADAPKRSNDGYVVGYSGSFGIHALEASLRHDRNSAYGNNTTGSLGWRAEVWRGLTLRALAGTTFRAPSFNDLYYPGYGVATVKPERGRSVEVGVAWRADATSAGLTLYRNRVRDLIGYDPDPDGTRCPPGDFGCAGNTSRARLQGATLTAGQHVGALDLRATLDLLDARDADTGVRLARRAAHQETLAADYDLGAWTIGASAIGVGARPDGDVVLGGYGVLDLRATWRIAPQWRLETKLLNALDHRIEPVRDYQGLGRQAWLGVRYDGQGL